MVTIDQDQGRESADSTTRAEGAVGIETSDATQTNGEILAVEAVAAATAEEREIEAKAKTGEIEDANRAVHLARPRKNHWYLLEW